MKNKPPYPQIATAEALRKKKYKRKDNSPIIEIDSLGRKWRRCGYCGKKQPMWGLRPKIEVCGRCGR